MMIHVRTLRQDFLIPLRNGSFESEFKFKNSLLSGSIIFFPITMIFRICIFLFKCQTFFGLKLVYQDLFLQAQKPQIRQVERKFQVPRFNYDPVSSLDSYPSAHDPASAKAYTFPLFCSLTNLPAHYQSTFALQLIDSLAQIEDISPQVQVWQDGVAKAIIADTKINIEQHVDKVGQRIFSLQMQTSQLSKNCAFIENKVARFQLIGAQVYVSECHRSCVSCTGPAENHCLGCFGDAKPIEGRCVICNDRYNRLADPESGKCVNECRREFSPSSEICEANQTSLRYFGRDQILNENGIHQKKFKISPDVAQIGIRTSLIITLSQTEVGGLIQISISNSSGQTIFQDTLERSSNEHMELTKGKILRVVTQKFPDGNSEFEVLLEHQISLSEYLQQELTILIENAPLFKNLKWSLGDFSLHISKCESFCARCYSASSCGECIKGFSLYNGKCVETCPPFSHSSNQRCVNQIYNDQNPPLFNHWFQSFRRFPILNRLEHARTIMLSRFPSLAYIHSQVIQRTHHAISIWVNLMCHFDKELEFFLIVGEKKFEAQNSQNLVISSLEHSDKVLKFELQLSKGGPCFINQLLINVQYCPPDCQLCQVDGCLESSQNCESGFEFSSEQSQCIKAPSCQNGIVEGIEDCDDGNDFEFDGCSPNCKFQCPSNCNFCSRGVCLQCQENFIKEDLKCIEHPQTANESGSSVDNQNTVQLDESVASGSETMNMQQKLMELPGSQTVESNP